MLLDPPRRAWQSGSEAAGGVAAGAISIVACDPATLARDLAGLMAAGYRMEAMSMVDLFPQTFHIETVVRLAK